MTTNEVILDAATTAKEFNANLKRIFKEELNLKVRVRIINSYKFPNCYVEVWCESDIPNQIRQLAASQVRPSKDFSGDANVNFGNIRSQSICVYATQWNALFYQYLDGKKGEHGL